MRKILALVAIAALASPVSAQSVCRSINTYNSAAMAAVNMFNLEALAGSAESFAQRHTSTATISGLSVIDDNSVDDALPITSQAIRATFEKCEIDDVETWSSNLVEFAITCAGKDQSAKSVKMKYRLTGAAPFKVEAVELDLVGPPAPPTLNIGVGRCFER